MSDPIIQAIQEGNNILLTGGAGVGKTYQTNAIIDHFKKKNIKFAVTAMTGLASKHLHYGMTIHRFLQIGGSSDPMDIHELSDKKWFQNNLADICNVEFLIIDEVSMMRSDLFMLMDEVLKMARAVRNIAERKADCSQELMPFGGYKLVLVGDFCQLPPVVQKHERVPARWIFQTELFKKADFKIFYLSTIKRTTDEFFAKNLNKLRVGFCDDEAEKMIRSRENKSVGQEATILMSRVDQVKEYNEMRLQGLSGASYILEGKTFVREEIYDQDEKHAKKLFRQVVTESGLDKTITLKEGCRVMLLANNPDMDYSNGSQGVFLGTVQVDPQNPVVELNGVAAVLDYKYFGECLKVLLDDGKREVLVIRKRNELYSHRRTAEGTRIVDASFSQFPITLGYAISIHKSQGMSLSHMVFDCNKIFAEGQFYVGISRARSLEGLSVINFYKQYVMADHAAVDFYLDLAEGKYGTKI